MNTTCFSGLRALTVTVIVITQQTISFLDDVLLLPARKITF